MIRKVFNEDIVKGWAQGIDFTLYEARGFTVEFSQAIGAFSQLQLSAPIISQSPQICD